MRTFNHEMPWGSVFASAVEDEDKWWRRHIENPGIMVNCGVHSAGHYTDGDATITNSKGVTVTGSDTSSVLPAITDGSSMVSGGIEGTPSGGWPRRGRKRGRYAVAAAPPKTAQETCAGFQTGKCTYSPDGLHCGAQPNKLHKCAYCKKQGHGESDCWLKDKGAGKGGKDGGGQLPWMRGGRGAGGGGRGNQGNKGKQGNKGRGRGDGAGWQAPW